MKKYFVSLFVIIYLLTINLSQAQSNLKYLNQTLPTDNPVIFAPGLISTGLYERDIAISKDGNEIYFCVALKNRSLTKIAVTKFFNGKWSKPEIADFAKNSDWNDVEPFISYDGNKFYFSSNRPNNSSKKENYDIWVMEKTKNGWGTPKNLGTPINSEGNEFFPSLTAKGTIYFTTKGAKERADHIYRSKFENGKYQNIEKLGKNVNCGISEFNAFISPDESYIIVSVQGRKDSIGPVDYYIVFRNNDDKWTDPINLGDKINTKGFLEYSPYVSRDGKYFFFMSARPDDNSKLYGNEIKYKDFQVVANKLKNGNPNIYWVKADFINNLKKNTAFKD